MSEAKAKPFRASWRCNCGATGKATGERAATNDAKYHKRKRGGPRCETFGVTVERPLTRRETRRLVEGMQQVSSRGPENGVSGASVGDRPK